ncbi:hypothetical protein OQJ18_03350 [Fluoribacter dumoffii]|uniref:hypothetical protein n=1 Tax=Fluoribacter dumoffii TaxID=463 RepID=UPI00224432D9|nr:hypothetical protein [Fluoribacter dumoffii]MCW8418882.1 hypothetical protein [Fluoribacter dumoffii]MCW8453274.1 hypothetical protein [Fluoribacter dumoffii]MCW8459505.1 hypothetical protein [Fluoribacter dumoffii]MCW8482865.1 hypothetical protein [Fluoribacter dumoffii]
MNISVFLAKAMGLYFLIISISVLINKNRMPSVVSELMKNPALQFLMGLNILIIGLLLILTHNIWVSSWQVLITIIAWAVFIKGVLNVAFPNLAQRMTKPFLQSQSIPYFAILINFLLGLYLCYYGFLY